MRKIVLIILVVILYAFSSGFAADRKVIGNTFQSDYPKLNIFYIIPYKDLWVTINYWEDATPAGMSCKNEYSMNMLSAEQKVYLSDFHNRALNAIGIGNAVIKQPTVTITKEISQLKQILDKKPIQKKGEVKSLKSIDIKAGQKQAALPPIPREKDRIKIAIVEFQNLNEESKHDNMGSMFSEMLTTSFVGSEAFRITEREQLQKVARELQFNQSGIIDVSQAKQVGKMVGADAIVTGSVTKIGGDLRLDARIIDVESGIILTAEKIMGKTDLNSISAMADTIVENLVNKFYRDKKHSTGRDTSNIVGGITNNSYSGWQFGDKEYGNQGFSKSSVDSITEANQTISVLRTDYKLSKNSWAPIENIKKRDWASFSGIEFHAKSDHDEILRFALLDANRDNHSRLDTWQASVKINTQWKLYRIDFKDLSISQHPNDLKLGGDSMLSLDLIEIFRFYISANFTKPGTSGTFWIREVRLY